MTGNQSPFQLGHPATIVPPPPPPEASPDPPRSRLARWWHSPPRVLFLLALVVAIIVLLVGVVLRDPDNEPAHVKDFDQAAAALHVEPVALWPRHEFSAATMRLPQRFEVFDVDPDLLIELGAGALGAEYAQAADFASEEMAVERLYFDRETGLANQVTITVMTMALDQPATPQQFLEVMNRTRWPDFYHVRDSALISVGNMEAARWIVDLRDDRLGLHLSMVMYVVVNNDTRTAWMLSGTSPAESFDDWLAIYQAAVGTLTYTPAG